MAYIGNSPGNIQRGRRAVYEFTSTAGQTAFSGVDDNGLTLDLLDPVENDVYLNGSRLILNDDYTISGDTLTLTSASALNDIIVIVTQDDIANAGSYTKAESDSRYINYDGDIVNGNIQVVGTVENLGTIVTGGSPNSANVALSMYATGAFLNTPTATAGYLSVGGSGKLKWDTDSVDSLVDLNVTGTVTADGLTVDTDTLFVDSTNNRVGIGTSAPAHALHVSSIGDAGIHIQADSDNSGENDNPYLSMSQDGATSQMLKIGLIGDANSEFTGAVTNAAFIHANNNYNQPLQLAHDGQEVATLYKTSVIFNDRGGDQDFRVESNNNADVLFVDASNDRVCIGHSSTGLFTASARFEVDATSNSRTAGITTKSSALCLGLWNTNNSSGTMIQFAYGTNGTDVGSITHNGSGTTYNTTSDRRLKDNIVTITDGKEKLLAMNPVTHTWIDNPEAPAVHGFIAQEMQDVIPEAVSGDAQSENMMSMDYGRITPVIVAALQDALKEIEELKARINKLEAK